MLRIITFITFSALFLFAFTKYLEKTNIFFPTKVIEATPDAFNLTFEDVFLPTSDGEKLNAWFVPAGPDGKVVLFFHGNAGNISHRLEQLVLFNKLGLNVFIIDYRGYGKSTGRVNEQGIYLDAQAAYNYLVHTRGVSPDKILLYGESLGSQAAIDLASKEKVAGLIAEGSFTSAADMAAAIYPFLPRIFLSIQFDALNKIAQVTCPVLIIHSRDDEIVPLRLGKKLFQAANQPKQFLELSSGHNEAVIVCGEIFTNALREFINTL
jgi:fermentation-respiration switch protein FrsA (DUF1100 family)